MTTQAPAKELEVFVVSHTHWDREWYRPAAQFQQRLVALIDELLDRADRTPFLLDGQAVVLEDYLELRPERASELSARLREGALEAGPWFVLPDELIPSGEALVRNLLAGRRVLSRLRAQAPPVLYCPDSFGHPASLPMLASGFDLPVTIVWRGYGGRRWPPGDVVRWRAADGATTLLYHLPPAGYEFGSHLPASPAATAAYWQTLRSVLNARATLGVVLLPHGADHHAPPPHSDAALASLKQVNGGDAMHDGTLASFAARLQDRAARKELTVIEGELRDSYGYTWTLAETLGSRAQLKRRNAIVERALLRDAEPWAALARFRDGKSRRHLVQAAWRSLLLTHPHDTLCGCSVDEVTKAVETRLDSAVSAAEGVRDEAMDALLGHNPGAARDRADEWRSVVVLRNRSAHRRSGVAEITVDVVVADVPVGPGSGSQAPPPEPPTVVSLGSPSIPVQVLGSRRTFAREESPYHYPRNRLVERRRAVAWVDAVPAFGLRVVPVHAGVRRRPKPSETVRARSDGVENSRLRVVVHNDGLTLAASDGAVLPNFLEFEAQGERGDLYTHSAIPDTRRTGKLVRTRVTTRGPLRAELATLWELDVPPRKSSSAAGASVTTTRSRILLRATLQLDAGAPFVRILVTGDNTARDVRIRCGIHTHMRAPHVHADAAFGPVLRERPDVPEVEALAERPAVTAPLHRYVTLSDDMRGCTIFSDGLAEYEATDDGVLWVTLVRGVGELSRSDLSERPGHAGWPVETPAAQSLGPFRAMFGVMPHGPRRAALVSHIEHVADDVLLPLVGHTWRTAIAPPDFVEGVQLVGRGLMASAVKESEDGDWIVLRCVNLLEDAVPGAWRVPGAREAWLARIDETPLGARSVQNGVIAFEAPPRGVVTFLVR